MHSLALFLSLLAFYVVLSGQIQSTFLMAAGVITCAGVTLISKRLGIVDDEGVPYRRWWATTKYIPWLMWQIVLSNIDVLKTVWRPKLVIQPQMIVIKHELKTAYGLSTYMNSITLTPGTLTIDVGENELLIHCLTQGVADDLRAGEMHRRCQAVEGTGGPRS